MSNLEDGSAHLHTSRILVHMSVLSKNLLNNLCKKKYGMILFIYKSYSVSRAYWIGLDAVLSTGNPASNVTDQCAIILVINTQPQRH